MTVFNGDCLDLMRQIPDGSIDMVMCDLPYGTTGVACVNTGRKFIGIEKDEKYFQIARDRIAFQEYLHAMETP
jgi:DNA modification methylase